MAGCLDACTKAVTKFILIVFNIVFVIIGLVVLGIGLYARFDDDGLTALFSKIPSDVITEEGVVDIPSLISSASLVLIIGGAFILVVGFLGCCGAWKEVNCFLIVYSFVLIVLIITEFGFVIVMYAAKGKIENHLFKFLEVTINKGYVGGTGFENGTFELTKDATTLAWDMSQFSLECCAAHGIDDYNSTTKWDHKVYLLDSAGKAKAYDAKVPLSCCKLKDHSKFPKEMNKMEFVNAEQCITNPGNDTTNIVGCYHAVKNTLLEYSKISAGVALGIALVEICGLICACLLYKTLKREGYDQYA